MWYVSQLLGAWVLSIGMAKLYDAELKNLADEERRSLRNWLAELPDTSSAVSVLALGLGKEFQRRRNPVLHESWESLEK
jgi:hypothetical protein